jgi:hypothetical protein
MDETNVKIAVKMQMSCNSSKRDKSYPKRGGVSLILFLFLFEKDFQSYLKTKHERRKIRENLFGQFAHGRKLRK